MQIVLEEVLVHAFDIADVDRRVLAPLRHRWLRRRFEQTLVDEWLSSCVHRMLAFR